MKPETLRKACELAGLEHSMPCDGWDCWWIPGGYEDHGMGDEHPALLPLVAERLVSEIHERPDLWLCRYEDALDCMWDSMALYAEAQYRILAAMVALGELTIEKAQAELEEG